MSKETVRAFFLKGAMVNGYGYSKNDIAELDQESFDRLKGLDLVKDYDQETDGLSVEVKQNKELEDLKLELQVAKDTIEELKGFVEKAINLPKGQKPAGYKKDT